MILIRNDGVGWVNGRSDFFRVSDDFAGIADLDIDDNIYIFQDNVLTDLAIAQAQGLAVPVYQVKRVVCFPLKHGYLQALPAT